MPQEFKPHLNCKNLVKTRQIRQFSEAHNVLIIIIFFIGPEIVL